MFARPGRPISIACAICLLFVVAGDRRPHAAAIQTPTPAARVIIPLDAGWRFSHADTGTAAMPAFDDKSWRVVDLPHDWSAEGPFTSDSASGTGYAPGGIGWYRKHFTLPAGLAGRVVTIELDGVYENAEVWVNGQFVCGRPNGYSSFACALSPHVAFGAADNVVAVRVDHSRVADSRFYTGSGIYRHVRLCLTDPLHIAHWGTVVTTPAVTTDAATVHVGTTIENASGQIGAVTLESEIWLGGDRVASLSTPVSIAPGATQAFSQDITLPRPRRWTFDTPVLYTLRQRIRAAAGAVDDVDTTFGIRTIRFDAQQGFFLNDEPVTLKGVAVHVDAGSLGVAVPEAVWERRLRALKALGVNAIRTSHNPPAPEFLDVCDRLGLLVMDEAFDEFTPSKNKWVQGRNVGVPSRFGYGEVFTDWSVTDASDMVRRDRNHPSIVMWSLGNEIDYPNDPFSDPVLGRSYRPQNPPAARLVTLARPLVDAVHALDPTRPVTMALASLEMSDAVGLPALLDVVGYNYQESRYEADHAAHPSRVILGSENGQQYANWVVVRDHPYVAGQFLWTGTDYLGEAGPFPNRANGAGLLDLCGFKKPMAWFRQSLWSDAPMVYLAASPAPNASATASGPRRAGPPQENWTWPAGSTLAVSSYTNADEVALALNDRPLGTKRRTDAVDGVLHWDVPYEPGVLKAVATNNGKPVAEFALTTAGPPARLELVADAATVTADGASVSQIEFRIVDHNGARVPTANAEVTFVVDGPARVLGIGNADLNDDTSGQGLVHRAYLGRGLAILQSTGAPGTITLRALAPGLESASVSVTAVAPGK